MTEAQNRPLPYVTSDGAAFWEGARSHDLILPRCLGCAEFHYYPRLMCPHCGSRGLEPTKVSGRGVVYSFSIQYRSQGPGFVAPYVTALIDLEEGPRMLANIVGIEPTPDDVRCGMAVEAVFEDFADAATIIHFQPRTPRTEPA